MPNPLLIRERSERIYEESPKAIPKYIRCKKCSEIIKITSLERELKVKCPNCGAEGKIKIS